MSINISVALQIPTNVVEVGNEITAQQLGAITSGSSPTSANPFTTVSYISGLSYLTTATASSTYQTLSGMTSYLTTSAASSTYQPIGSYLTDAPSDGSEYVRKNAAWAVATGGGGGGISDAPSDGNLYARQNAAWTSFSVTPSVTNIDLTGNFNGYSLGSGYYTFKFDSTANTLRMEDGAGSGITISPTGITFPNSSVLTTAPVKSVYLITGGFTLALSDANNIIYADSSAGGGMSYTISIPEDSTTNFPVGTVIQFVANAGSGATVDFNSAGAGSPTIYGTTSYGGGSVHQAFLTKVAANTWIIK
jgi:hypothetical protein